MSLVHHERGHPHADVAGEGLHSMLRSLQGIIGIHSTPAAPAGIRNPSGIERLREHVAELLVPASVDTKHVGKPELQLQDPNK